MKKLISIALIILSNMQVAHATDTANIKIKIAGAMQGNRYFLCLPNVGCLSIHAAQNGKVYPIMNDVEMNTMFVTDTSNDRLYRAGLPDSCNVTVKTNQTITISGELKAQGDQVTVRNLHCSVS